jgi:hypothetical protein
MSNIVEYIHNNPEESQRLLGLHVEQLKQLIEKAIELHNSLHDSYFILQRHFFPQIY